MDIKYFMKSNLNLYYLTQEIKTFGLGSGIQDMALWDELSLSAKVCVPYSVFGL